MKLLDLMTIEEFNSQVSNVNKSFSTEDKKTIINMINETLSLYVKQDFTELQLKEFIKRHSELFQFTKQFKSKNSIKINHNFDWTKGYDLSLEAAESYSLIKGVAMTEGEAKRGEIMTQENLRFATGAMAASAMLGFAVLDIDHFPEALPEDGTYSKYNIEKINDIYPLGMIIDAELSLNKVGTEGKELWQVEFLGVCENSHVYDMIKQGKFKACSVMDFPREYSCDECNSETGKCTCNVSGSKFMYNTLILEAVPNSNSTWISVVDKKDIGSILKPNGLKTSHAIDTRIELCKKNKNTSYKIKNAFTESDVSKYKTDDGVWINGVDSIKEFLVTEKQIPEEQASSLAEYINANPEALSTDQLTYMSGDDFLSWFENLNNLNKAKLYKFIKQNKLQIETNKIMNKTTLDSHSTDEIKKAHLIQLTKEEVNYGPGEDGSLCRQCRWFFTSDEEPTDETEGGCALVEGTILGNQTCDRFESIPSDTDGDGENDSHPPNEDGNCDEGFHLSEDGTTCIADSQESTVDTSDESENDAKAKELELKELEEAANQIPSKKIKVKPSTMLSVDSKTTTSYKIDDLDKQINELITKRNEIGMIIGRGREQMKKQNQYEQLTKEIKALQAKKYKIDQSNEVKDTKKK